MENKVVVITGASGGIGAALAMELGRHGHSLVLGARRKEELERVARTAGSSALAVVTDVCERSQVNRLRDAAFRQFGRIDVWVNNAGRGIGRPVADLTDEDLDEMFKVNLKSALYGMQAVLPHFKEREEGQIINVSSFLGRVPLASYRSAYNAAKSALNVLTANLRMDLRTAYPRIHVSLVMPGVVSTDFSANVLHNTTMPRSVSSQGRSAEETAVAIAGLLDAPKAELYTNPALAETAANYFRDVAAFEDRLSKQSG